MCNVYKGSYICIAALDSLANSDGLFAERDPLVYFPCFLSDEDANEQVYATDWRTEDSFHRKTWPLHCRGWVQQEKVLSGRTVGFGQFLSWECRQTSRDEFGIEYLYKAAETACGLFFNVDNCEHQLDEPTMEKKSTVRGAASFGGSPKALSQSSRTD